MILRIPQQPAQFLHAYHWTKELDENWQLLTADLEYEPKKYRQEAYMKAVLQRVESASVMSDGKLTGQIGQGYVILLGVAPDDTWQEAERMAEKIKKLRIFPDDNGKTNLSAADINAEALVVSQFTLYADCAKGNRPSFTGAAIPEHAELIYDTFVKMCRERFVKVACGVFGAHMKVSLINDGPFTVVLEM